MTRKYDIEANEMVVRGVADEIRKEIHELLDRGFSAIGIIRDDDAKEIRIPNTSPERFYVR